MSLMAQVSLDDFIEAFAARLVMEGHPTIRLGDPGVRDGLFRVHRFLERCLARPDGVADKDWRRSLITLRAVFRPSAIGAFDRFAAVLRAKQVYLTACPGPGFQDIVVRMPVATARQVADGLDRAVAGPVAETVRAFLPPDQRSSGPRS